uniref:Small ribosomal subunit protein uS3c n=1 Tax=Polytoma uvella TaxID=40532 RepID=A0A1L2M5C3_9CHLO|nr:ribosomal protein S3 [Polytoma uvella]
MSVHPLGFRIGITKKHQSQWFARFHKNNYKNNVIEDRMLINYLLNNYFFNTQTKKKVLSNKNVSTKSILSKITRITIERNLIPAEIIIHIHAVNCYHLLSNLHSKTNATLFTGKHVRPTPKESTKKNILLNLVQRKINLFVNKLIHIKKQRVSNPITQRSFLGPLYNPIKTLRANTHNHALSGDALSINEVSRGGQKKGGLNATLIRLRFSRDNNHLSRYDNHRLTVSILTSHKTHFGTPNNITTPKERFVSAFISILNKKFLQSLKAKFNNKNTLFLEYLSSLIKRKASNKNLSSNAGILRATTKTPLLISESYKSKDRRSRYKQTLRKKTLSNLRKKYFTKINLVTEDRRSRSNKTTQRSLHLKRLFLGNTKSHQHVQPTNIHATLQPTSIHATLQPIKYANYAPHSLLGDKESEDRRSRYSKIKILELLQQRIKLHKKQHFFHYLSSIKKFKIDSRCVNKICNQLLSSQLGSTKNKHSKLGCKTSTQNKHSKLGSTHNKHSKLGSTHNKHSKLGSTHNKQESTMGLKQHVDESTTAFLIHSRGIQNTSFYPKIVLKFYSVGQKIHKTKALFVADTVAEALENRKSFKGVIKKQKGELMRSPGVKGIKIKVAGRLNGAEIARSEWVRAGRVPLQTLRANIDYAFKTAKTIYGLIGIKVWIYKN